MAIATYCHLRPPDVAPVVLIFKYDARNAPACVQIQHLYTTYNAPTHQILAQSDNPRLNYFYESPNETMHGSQRWMGQTTPKFDQT